MTKPEAREWVERKVAREWLMRFLYSMDVHAMEPQDLDDWFAVFDAQNDAEEPVNESEEPIFPGERLPDEAEDVWPTWEEGHRLTEQQKTFIRKSVASVLTNLEEIDEQITRYLKGWEYSRLPKVDKAIMRLATNEILFDDTIPVGVSINEAVELSKRYSSDTSFRFLNGVLGNIARGGEA